MNHNTMVEWVRHDSETLTAGISCHGTTHEFAINSSGQIMGPYYHDVEQDAVMTALGGKPHGCFVARVSLRVAMEVGAARTGLHDIPGVSSFQAPGQVAPVWTDGYFCPHYCNTRLVHISSVKHQSARRKASFPLATSIREWLAQFEPRRGKMANAEALHTMSFNHAGKFKSVMVNPAFIAAGACLFLPETAQKRTAYLTEVETDDVVRDYVHIRANGVRVEWLRDFTANLTPEAVSALRVDPELPGRLIEWRNEDPRAFAAWCNANKVMNLSANELIVLQPAL